jgi:hypothetical protein
MILVFIDEALIVGVGHRKPGDAERTYGHVVRWLAGLLQVRIIAPHKKLAAGDIDQLVAQRGDVTRG